MILLRKPTVQDGHALHALIAACPPLDPNSTYCNLLQCCHFAETAVAAECEGQLVGFISGYCPPGREDTLFVWQVAVHSSMRGQGLGAAMLSELVDRCEVNWIETTITQDNPASWGMFHRFARLRSTHCQDRGIYFDSEAHFSGQHASEHLVQLGPFQQGREQ